MPAFLEKVLVAPQFADDEEKSRRAELLYILSWAAIAIALFYAVAIAMVEVVSRSLLALLVIPLLFGVQWLMRRGHVRLSCWSFCLVLCIVLFVYAATTTESRGLAIDSLIVVVMVAGLLLGFRAALGFAAFSVCANIVLWFAGTSGRLPSPPIKGSFFNFVVMHFVLVLAALFVLHLATRSLERALARVKEEGAERQRSNTLLRRMSQVVEQSPSTVAITDTKGDLEYVNPGFTRITGYESAEVIGKNPRVLNSGTHSQAFYRELWDTIRAGEEWRGEFVNQRKDGGRYWELASISPLRDDAGAITHFIKVAEDITFRKQSEHALQMSEARFREMADHIREVFWLFDWIEQKVIYVNPVYEDVWGRSTQDLMAACDEWVDSVYSEDREYAAESFASIAETGGGKPREYRIVRPDGEIRWIFDRGFAIHDDDGQVVRVAGIAEDITDRKQVEQALRQSESKFRSVVERSTDGIVLTDEWGNVIEWNPGAEQITGLRAADALQRPIWDVQVGLDLKVKGATVARAEAEVAARTILETGDGPWLHRVMDESICHADGTQRMVQSVVFSIPTERGFQIASIMRDVTESRRTERSLIESLTRYRVLFENANDAIFIMENDRFVECNPRTLTMYGYSRDQIIGKTPFELSPPVQPDGRDSKEKALEVIQAALQGQPQRFDWCHIRGDGTLFDVTVSLNRIEISGEKFLQAVVHDITDRVRAEVLVQRRLEIERAVSLISSNFIENTDLGTAMAASLGVLGEISGADRVCVFQFDADMTEMSNTSEWHRDSVTMQIDNLQNLDLGIFAWIVLKLQNDELVQIFDVASLPDDLVDLKMHLEAQAIQSLLAVPIVIENQLCGFLGLDNVSQPRSWSEDDWVLLRVVAEIFSNALARHRTSEALQSSLCEKEALLQEIHHRVNNTMQIIQSLLRIQASHIEDTQIRGMFDESHDRIRSMALVHEKLYRSQSLAQINMDDYVRSLATHLFQSYRVEQDEVDLQVDVSEDIAFGIATAIPCGLVLNELISNALKHAFPRSRPQQTDTVYVGLQRVEDRFELMVGDNGAGLPDSIDFWSVGSLGLQLVQIWIEQLDAQVNVERTSGTTIRLTFAESGQQELEYGKS